MTDCVFCKIVAGELPCHKIYEDDQVLAMLDAGHVNPGHTLVIAKNHAADMMELDEEIAAQAFRIANRISKAQMKSFAPDGVTILQANREIGFQTVFHFHLHVVPRHEGDGMKLTWPAKMPAQAELAGFAAELKEAL
jgi:histidine triad (HIT) family protein